MKNKLLIALTILSLSFMPQITALAQPSFEVYCTSGSNCVSYPVIGNVTATRSGDYETITVSSVTDTSGVLYQGVTAIVRDSDGKKMATETMKEVGTACSDPGKSCQYVVSVRVSDWEEGTYSVDISATDRLSNNSMAIAGKYTNTTTFDITVEGSSCATSSKGATVCIDVSPHPTLISSGTDNQSITLFETSGSGNAITFTAGLPAAASGELVYFVDQTTGFLGEGVIGTSLDSPVLASLTYTYDSSSPGPHVIAAIYGGNILKGLNPSIATVTIER